MDDTSNRHRFEGVRRIEIASDAAGIRVDAGQNDATFVALTDRRGAPLDELLQLRQDGDLLRVEVKAVRGGRWRKKPSIAARLQVATPSDVAVSVDADAGSVRVEDRTAAVRVAADAGRVQLARITGDVEVKTDAGAITLVDGIGSATVTSDVGAVTIERQQGERLALRTDVGSISATQIEVGTLDAHTDVGKVRIVHATPPVLVDVSCSVGAVTLELPPADYAIDQQKSGLGRTRIEGLESVPGAERIVRVRSTGVGAVTIRAVAGEPVHA